MTPGKAQAHSSHASNQFMWNVVQNKADFIPKVQIGFDKWVKSANGFGTQINLKANTDEEMSDWVDKAKSLGYLAEHIIDPTYPYFVHSELYNLIDTATFTLSPKYIPEQDSYLCYRSCWTASYVFDHNGDGTIKQLNKNFILHP